MTDTTEADTSSDQPETSDEQNDAATSEAAPQAASAPSTSSAGSIISHRSSQDVLTVQHVITHEEFGHKPSGDEGIDNDANDNSAKDGERENNDAVDEAASTDEASAQADEDTAKGDTAESERDEGASEVVDANKVGKKQEAAAQTATINERPTTAEQTSVQPKPPMLITPMEDTQEGHHQALVSNSLQPQEVGELESEYINCKSNYGKKFCKWFMVQDKSKDREIIYFRESKQLKKIEAVCEVKKEETAKLNDTDKALRTASPNGPFRHRRLDHYVKRGKRADEVESRFDVVKWFLDIYGGNPEDEQKICEHANPEHALTVWLEVLIAGCRYANATVIVEALEYFGARQSNKNTDYLIQNIAKQKGIKNEVELLESLGYRSDVSSFELNQAAPGNRDSKLEALHLMHRAQNLARSSEEQSSRKEPAEGSKPLILFAAKTSNIRVFQYTLHHFVMKKCQGGSQGSSPLIESLRQVNEQKRNALHAVFALPNLSVVYQMLSEIDGLLPAPDKEKVKGMEESFQVQDVFGKTPLHYLLDRYWPIRNEAVDESVFHNLKNIIDMIFDKWKINPMVSVREDSEGLNLLFALVKSKGLKYVDALKSLIDSPNAKINLRRRLLFSNKKSSMDIAHVFAAYGDLTQLEPFVREFCGITPRWQQDPPDQAPELEVMSSHNEMEADGNSSDVLIGWSVIHFACMRGNEKNIKLLLKKDYRLNELTAGDEWNGIDLAVFYSNSEIVQKVYEDVWKQKKKDRWWLSSYLTVLDPVSRAIRWPSDASEPHGGKLPKVSRQTADRVLKDSKYAVHFEKWQNKISSQFSTGEAESPNERSCDHFINCLLQPDRVEPYLYLCLRSDSVHLYHCLINSTYWNTATATQSVNDIEWSTVRFILERRAFKERIKDRRRKSSDNCDDEAQAMGCGCCGCRKLPSAPKASSESKLLPYLDNGRVFKKNLKLADSEFRKYSLVGLALQMGRIEMVKGLLVTRQTDLIPTALQIIIQAMKMIDVEKSRRTMIKDNEHLKEAKDFAYKVLMNALNTLHAGTTSNQADLIVRYLLGELSVPESAGETNATSSFLRKLYIREDDRSVKCREIKYQKGIVLDSSQPELQAGADGAVVDFYVRGRGEEAAFEEGPLFQHHLRRSACVSAADDRRRLKCCIRSENDLPLYSILDLAKKASISEIFATECFKMVAETLWNRSIVSSRHKHQKDYSIPEKLLTPKWIVLYYTCLHVVYLAFLMKYMLSESIFFGWEHLVIAVYLVAFLAQETAEIVKQVNRIGHGLQEYVSDPWNWFDLLTLGFTIAGLAMTAAIQVDLTGAALTNAQKQYYLNDTNRLNTVFASKMVLGFGFLCSFIKLLHVLRYMRSTGPSLTIFFYVLIRDLIPFALIVAVMVMAFGTYFYAMLTIGGGYFQSNDTYDSDRERMTLFEVFSRPLLDAFGELDLESLQRCRDSLRSGEAADLCYYQHGVNIYTYCGVLIFLLLVNLVMFNMLIARFSLTISKYDKMSEAIWLQNRQRLLLDFSSHWTLPPPVNLLYLLMVPFVRLGVWLGRRPAAVEPQPTGSKKKHMEPSLENYLLLQADRFRNCRHRFYEADIESYGDTSDSVNVGTDSRIRATISLEGGLGRH